jgi:hypothetical protein
MKIQLQVEADNAASLTAKLHTQTLELQGMSCKLANKTSDLQTLAAEKATLQDQLRAAQREEARLQLIIDELDGQVEKLERIGQDLITYRGESLMLGLVRTQCVACSHAITLCWVWLRARAGLREHDLPATAAVCACFAQPPVSSSSAVRHH